MTAAPFILVATFVLQNGDSFDAYEETTAKTVEMCKRDADEQAKEWDFEYRQMKADGIKPFFKSVRVRCEVNHETEGR